MTWPVVIVLIVATIAKLLTAPPHALVVWITKKFALHQKFNHEDVVVTYDGKNVEGKEKEDFIEAFNEANFLVRNSIFKGNEKYYINPELDSIPYIIHTKKGKADMTLTVYYEDSRIEVIRLVKKSVISYSVSSEPLKAITTRERIIA